MNLYLFNPENDLAIAFGGENYTPPPAAQLIGKELSALPEWYRIVVRTVIGFYRFPLISNVLLNRGSTPKHVSVLLVLHRAGRVLP